jgi:hypothetical protein
MIVLFDSGISFYRVAVAMASAVNTLGLALRYLTQQKPPRPKYKWQYYLAHIA